MLKQALMPYVVRGLTSDWLLQTRRRLAEKQRVRKDQPHRLDVFIRINDPYSYLLLQVLPEFAERFDIELCFHTVLDLPDEMYPAPQLWLRNAVQDTQFLAGLYALEAPAQALTLDRSALMALSAQLLHWELQPGYLEKALALFQCVWRGRDHGQLLDVKVTKHPECYHHALQFNQQLLADQGHYMSAMIAYGGEWYWGLDRLDHLEGRLSELGANRAGDAQPAREVFTQTYANFCQQLPRQSESRLAHPLQFFYSARSPYSYLALERVVLLAQHYRARLEIKPVLPMVMRNMKVPRKKALYILGDTKREAKKLGLAFGFFADPLGAGVERCYALFDYASAEGKAVDFLLSYARGVYSEGLNAASDKGLQTIVERAGLSWSHARGLLGDASWRIWAQDNLADMYSHDQWGVPTTVYGDTAVFGQDRLGLIEQVMAAELKAAP